MSQSVLLFSACLIALVGCACAAGEVGQGRLTVTVTEPGGEALPCRVHLTVGGQPVYAPGTPRFERDPHFCCPGRFEVAVPAGKATLRVERGPEYLPFESEFEIAPGQQRQVPVELSRWIDMNDRGWFSGDLHVHRPVAYMPLLLQAEDLNLAPVLTHWNRQHFETEPPYLIELRDHGAASPKPRAFHTLAQEDERAGGAIMVFNLGQPIRLDGVTRDHPSGFAYHQRALEQGAWVEVEKPFWWEAPVHVALGKVASLGIVCNHLQRTEVMDNEAWGRRRDRTRYPGPTGFALHVLDLWYRYLNLGYQIPASAGSASGVLKNPLGYNRVYARLDRFSYGAWFEALAAGRNFVTNGPMLFATANGKLPGERFEVRRGRTLEAEVTAQALCRDPLARLEIVAGGEVVAAVEADPADPRSIAIRRTVTLDRSTWLAVRAFEPTGGDRKTVRLAHTSPFYVTVGGEPPRDPAAARFYVAWLDELIAATARKQAAAKDPKPFDPLLDTYRRARAVYDRLVVGR